MILQRSVKYILWLYNWSLQESIPAVLQNKDGPKMPNSLLLTVESSISEWETGGLILFLERKEKEQEEKAKQERKKFKTNETSGPM